MPEFSPEELVDFIYLFSMRSSAEAVNDILALSESSKASPLEEQKLQFDLSVIFLFIASDCVCGDRRWNRQFQTQLMDSVCDKYISDLEKAGDQDPIHNSVDGDFFIRDGGERASFRRYASIDAIIYLKYFFPWKDVSVSVALGVIFAEVALFSFIILISSTLTLELIQQLERGQSLSLGKAWEEVIGRDLLKIIPLALCWAIIWFILTIIEALLSRRDKDDADDQFDAAHVAETLANYRDFSLSRAFIEALEKGVRMIVFLILPAIAWEDLSLLQATKKGFRVLKAHLAEFASGYALTYLAALLVFLPPAIMFKLGIGRHGNPPLIVFPQSVWVGVIIYIGFAWSFCMYLEQMFTATLYLVHLKWEEAINTAKTQGKPSPSFRDVLQSPGRYDKVLSEYLPDITPS